MTGKQLKIWQIERDISNVRLCELLGVSKRTVENWRRDSVPRVAVMALKHIDSTLKG